MSNPSRAALLAALLAFAAPAPARAFAVPTFTPNVVDQAGVLTTAEVERLNGTIAGLRQSRILAAVLIVPSTAPESIEEVAGQVFRAWQLGSRGTDNGLLLLVAVQDRRMRIEVGYGLEGAIPDVEAGRIVRGLLAPAFRRRDFAGGIEQALLACGQLARGEPLGAPALEGETPLAIGPLRLFAIWAVLVVLVPILLRAAAVLRALGYRAELRPSQAERSPGRILFHSGWGVFLTLFLLVNPGIFWVLMVPGAPWLALLFAGFAYVFLAAVNGGYLAMLRESWWERYRSAGGKVRPAYAAWGRGSGSRSPSSSSSWSSGGSGSSGSSSSSSGGGSSGGGGASGSW